LLSAQTCGDAAADGVSRARRAEVRRLKDVPPMMDIAAKSGGLKPQLPDYPPRLWA
jgi:hypothetical protein